MKKFILLTLGLVFILQLCSQILDDIDEELFVENPIVEMQYQRKSAKKAMLMSAIFPGAGQFYISKKSPTAYIFPVIEIGLWFAMYHYNQKGDDVTNDYEKFADKNYNRLNQYKVQKNLINVYPNDIYNDGGLDEWGNGSHFRLDKTNTQHYYEDIGKYNRYIFGWNDWFSTYVDDQAGSIQVNWVFDGDVNNPSTLRWIGNRPVNNPSQDSYDKPKSALRDKYIGMRQDAEDNYSLARSMSFFILLNHAVSTYDAHRVTKNYNRNYLKTTSISPKFMTTFVENRVVPMLGLTLSF